MPSVDAGALRERLASLAVVVERVEYVRNDVALPHDPEGRRPSGHIVAHGRGVRGVGEFVGWTEDEHEQARATTASWSPGEATVGEATVAELPAHIRAARECALLDLALRQASMGLFDISAGLGDRAGGARATALRYVVSFSRDERPLERIDALRPIYTQPEFKIDVCDDWSEETLVALRDTGAVRIFDLKGEAGDAAALRRIFPTVILEDVGAIRDDVASDPLDGPLAIDQSLLSAADVRPGHFHNIKIGRMGGVLAALEAIARCQELDAPFYWGGMYEVGAGRRQAQSLAALLCADAPNDLAPLSPPCPAPKRLPPQDSFGAPRSPSGPSSGP